MVISPTSHPGKVGALRYKSRVLKPLVPRPARVSFYSLRLLPVPQSLQTHIDTHHPLSEHAAMGRSVQTPERSPSLGTEVLPPRVFSLPPPP